MLRRTQLLFFLNGLLLVFNLYMLQTPDQVDVQVVPAVIEVSQSKIKSSKRPEWQPTAMILEIGEHEARQAEQRQKQAQNRQAAAPPKQTASQPAVKAETQETHGVIGQEGVIGGKATSPPVKEPKQKSPTEEIDLSRPITYPQSYIDTLKKSWAKIRPSYHVPAIKYTDLVNCASLLADDEAEMNKAEEVIGGHHKIPIYEEEYDELTQNCSKFRQDRGYVQVPLTKEEEDYPLAFSISMFKDVEQTERLLRAIYQPQNVYCIHIDTKTSLLIHRTMKGIASCLHNVFIATDLRKIKWGDVSVLLPAIMCMRDLVKYYAGRWRYFINLTGQEFPLRTNFEQVRIAKIFNGANDIAGSISRMDPERVNFIWTHRWSKTYQQTIFYNTYVPKAPPPSNLTFYKGEIHGLFSHRMVEYIVESEVAKQYLDWCWDSGHPSEHYWNTLNYNRQLHVPGGYIGPQDVADAYSFSPAVRAKHWEGANYGNRECMGKVVRGICVYGVGDLPWLHQRREMVANKFYLTYHYLAYDCLEERHRNRTRLKSDIDAFFDERYYLNLPTVRFSKKDGV